MITISKPKCKYAYRALLLFMSTCFQDTTNITKSAVIQMSIRSKLLSTISHTYLFAENVYTTEMWRKNEKKKIIFRKCEYFEYFYFDTNLYGKL